MKFFKNEPRRGETPRASHADKSFVAPQNAHLTEEGLFLEVSSRIYMPRDTEEERRESCSRNQLGLLSNDNR